VGESFLKIRRSAAGLHLFDRRSGLNVLDERVTFDVSKRDKAPRYVSLALTNACELQCPYCYAPKRPARLIRDKVLEWAIELDENGCLGVGLGGGEPTAHPDFVSICRDLSRSTDMALTMTTHGHRFDPRLTAQLDGHLNFIRVSVDGVGPTYERLRGRPFPELRSRLKEIGSIARFGINTVINESTIGDLDAVAEFAMEIGASELLLLPQMPGGGLDRIDPTTARTLADWIANFRGELPLTISAARVPNEVTVCDPSEGESELEAHAHIDAFALLRANAFDKQTTKINGSVIASLESLRRRRKEKDEDLAGMGI
jgi:molybdenum cofactor biosynthesis enzyme MoaA